MKVTQRRDTASVMKSISEVNKQMHLYEILKGTCLTSLISNVVLWVLQVHVERMEYGMNITIL